MFYRLFIICLFPIFLLSQCKSNSVEVIALADLFVDYTIFVNDQDLQELGLSKGSWNPLSEKEWNRSLARLGIAPSYRVGGSGMNVIKALHQLQQKCACIGKKGDDPLGKEVEEKLLSMGILTALQPVPSSTSKVLCLITEDGERTMLTLIQDYASHPGFLEPLFFEKAKLLHIEGYQIVNFPFVVEACKLAKKYNLLISLDLGSANLLSQYRQEFQEILTSYVDIVFCNAQEAKAFVNLPPKLAAMELQKYCKIAVVTNGKKGGWIAHGKSSDPFRAFESHPVDTTGAGDFFAAGFLYSYLQGYSPKTCTLSGAKLASYVIQYQGTDLPPLVWTLSAMEIDDLLTHSLVLR